MNIQGLWLTSDVQDFMATKLWESPTKAHLRGAVALLNIRKSKGTEAPVSPFLEHTVQTQIVKRPTPPIYMRH